MNARYQTAGSPSLRGSVAAASEPPGSAGPPATSSIACSWPRFESKAAVGTRSWPSAAQRVVDAVGVTRLQVDGRRRREVIGWLDVEARRGDGGPDIEPAVDDGADELGMDLRLGIPAHRADDDPRLDPTAPEQHPGEQRAQRPLARARARSGGPRPG